MMMGELDFSIIDVFEGNVSVGEGWTLDNLFSEELISSLLRPNPCIELSNKSVYKFSENVLCFFSSSGPRNYFCKPVSGVLYYSSCPW